MGILYIVYAVFFIYQIGTTITMLASYAIKKQSGIRTLER